MVRRAMGREVRRRGAGRELGQRSWEDAVAGLGCGAARKWYGRGAGCAGSRDESGREARWAGQGRARAYEARSGTCMLAARKGDHKGLCKGEGEATNLLAPKLSGDYWHMTNRSSLMLRAMLAL